MADGHIIVELLENTVQKYPELAAVRWIEKKQIPQKTYYELNETRNKIASSLLRNGFEGKHAAMVGTSSYEWISTYLGILSTKMVCVPLDSALPPAELCGLISRSDSEILFISPKMSPLVTVIKKNCPAVRSFVILGDVEDNSYTEDPSVVSLAKFTELETGAAIPQDRRPLPDDTCTIIFTSGTTSKP